MLNVDNLKIGDTIHCDQSGRTFREVVDIKDNWIIVRSDKYKPYRLSKEAVEKYWSM
jgi:hypothetical protein